MSDTPGTRLKNARLARGLSVEDITAATKMRPNIVLSLEADDYTHFPSITHARNFLSLYGKHLKIDVTDGLNQLATPAKIGIENYQYLNVEHHENTSYRVPRQPMRLRPLRGQGSGNGQAPRSLGLIALIIIGVLVIGYLAINLRRLNLSAPGSAETTPAAAESSGANRRSPLEGKSPAEGSPQGMRGSAEQSPATPLTSSSVVRNTNNAAPAATPFYAKVPGNRRLIRTPTPTPFE